MTFELDIIDDYEETVGVERAYDKAIAFMLDYLTYYSSRIPAPISEWIEVAKALRSGTLNIGDLDIANAECWRFIKDSSNASAKMIAGAVLFVLYPSPGPGISSYDLVVDFLNRANKFEDHSDKVELLLKRHFRMPMLPPNDQDTSEIT